MAGKLRVRCYLLKKQPYSETSVLMQCFSESHGMISVLAKGIRKGKEHSDHLLNVLNEYEFIITQASASGMHTLSELALLEEYPADLPLDNWFAAQAGAEILTKLMIPDDENPLFYKALKQYLTYIRTVTSNPIAIFWRYLLHLLKLLGIPMNPDTCSCCQKVMERAAGFTIDTGLPLCNKCLPAFPVAHNLDAEASNIISLLPVIGNYLEDLAISPETARQINRFFLHYLSVHFHKNFHLNSLEYFEPK
jgi:DNA repair protein RecO